MLFISASALFALICRLSVRPPAGRFPFLLGTWVLLAPLVEFTGGALTLLEVNNILLYCFYWPVEFALLVGIYQALRPKATYQAVSVFALFLLIWAVDLWFAWSVGRFVTISVIIGAFLLSALYLVLLWDLANTWTGRLRRAPLFWLCLAVLVYYGTCAPLLGSINYFGPTDRDLARQLYRITQVMCVLKFVLMGIACLHLKVLHNRVPHERTV